MNFYAEGENMPKTEAEKRANAKWNKEKSTLVGVRYTNDEHEKLESFCAFMHTKKAEILKLAVLEMAEKYGWDWDKQHEK